MTGEARAAGSFGAAGGARWLARSFARTFARTLARSLACALGLGLSLGAGLGAGPTAVLHAQDARILSVEVTSAAGVYHVNSTAHFSSSLASVYAVLSDYGGLHRLSDIVTESVVLPERAPDGGPRVRTALKGCVLFFCRTVIRVERVQAVQGRIITSHVEPALSDFREGFTEWRFRPLPGGGTEVTLRMRIVPDFWIPPVVGPPAVRRKLESEGRTTVLEINRLARALDARGDDA
jgi:hypothetical protein